MLKPLVDPAFSDLTELQLLQDEAVRFVKELTGLQIVEEYPLFKQLNVIAQGDETAKSEMVQFINQRRADCDAMEKTISACTTIDELATLPFLTAWVSRKQS